MTTSPLQKIRHLVKQGEHEAALSMCNEALAGNELDHEIIREKVSILGKLERTQEATNELELLVAHSEEPADYFDLARNYIRQEDYAAAVTALDKLLAISEREDFDYYTSSARFLRAFALIEMGRKGEAEKDIQVLDSDMRFWIPGKGLVTIEQLKAAA